MNPLEALDRDLDPLRRQILDHPLYAALASERAVLCFMEHHVFAVWDFMSLVKSLARRLTCVESPWIPTGHPEERRFLNQIVLDEESDLDAQGRPTSHFELYLEAMRDAGADRGAVDRMIEALRLGAPVGRALDRAAVGNPIRCFVENTLELAAASDVEVAAAFAFGRELVIPPMFREVVGKLQDADAPRWNRFVDYLERHIETDGETHGPIARALVTRLIGEDPERLAAARHAAIRALEARLALWDGIVSAIAEG